MDITNKLIGGLSWTSLSVGTKGFVQLLQMILLANQLEKEELGLVVIIFLIVSLTNLFVDFGLSNAIIYNKKLSDIQLNDMHWLNIIFGFVFSILIFSISDGIASFYGVNDLSSYIDLLCIVFVVRAFGIQGFSLLQRDLDFKSIAKIEISSSLASMIVLVILLGIGWGVYALIVSQIISALFFCIFGVIYSGVLFPRLTMFKVSRIKDPLSYGIYQTSENFINFFSANSDAMIISKGLGMSELGIYGYIRDLVLKPILQVINNILNRVSFPVFSRLNETGNLDFFYISKFKFLILLNLLYLLPVIFYPDLFLTLIYGDTWVEYSTLLQVACVYVFFLSISNPISSLLKATGNVKISFRWNTFVSILRPIVVLYSIGGGVYKVIISLTILSVFTYILNQIYVLRQVTDICLKGWFKMHLNLVIIVVAMSFYYYLSIVFGLRETLAAFGFVFVLLLLVFSLMMSLFKELKSND